MNRFNIQRPSGSITRSNGLKINNTNRINNNSKSFDEILNKIKDNKELKFSKHAKQRLESRNIKLNDDEINAINDAINKAEKKGVKEALILMNNTAFIASVNNKTIITTATSEQLKENIFTNIDGAVII